MAEKITSINPRMLEWARMISGTTLDYVGERIGGIDRVVLWEKGEDYPTYNQLKELCQIYRKPSFQNLLKSRIYLHHIEHCLTICTIISHVN